jgi:transcriptional regulator with XRE-family HTH domain
MDVALLIRHRLKELGLEQKDLAASAQVTESYISQLLARKKSPPAPGRTDIYEKLGKILGLAGGELSKLAEQQRKEELRKRVADPPRPLFKDRRELTLRKCDAGSQKELRRIFEKEPFGELERLVMQTLLGVTQNVVRKELHNEKWVRLVAEVSGRSYKRVRGSIPAFLKADVFNVSVENCATFPGSVIDSWDIDLRTFDMKVALNGGLAQRIMKQFAFAEQALAPVRPAGLEQFLNDSSLSGDATEEEVEFLKGLQFRERNPSPIYYYRELQSLRDPLHFPGTERLEENSEPRR